MKDTILLLLILLALVSCEENNPDLAERDLLGWKEIIIPNGREAEAITGNINLSTN